MSYNNLRSSQLFLKESNHSPKESFDSFRIRIILSPASNCRISNSENSKIYLFSFHNFDHHSPK